MSRTRERQQARDELFAILAVLQSLRYLFYGMLGTVDPQFFFGEFLI